MSALPDSLEVAAGNELWADQGLEFLGTVTGDGSSPEEVAEIAAEIARRYNADDTKDKALKACMAAMEEVPHIVWDNREGFFCCATCGGEAYQDVATCVKVSVTHKKDCIWDNAYHAARRAVSP